MYWTEKHLLIFFCKEKLMFCGQHTARVIQKNWFLHMALPVSFRRPGAVLVLVISAGVGQVCVCWSLEKTGMSWEQLLSPFCVCSFPPCPLQSCQFLGFSLCMLASFRQSTNTSAAPRPCHRASLWGPDRHQGREKMNLQLSPSRDGLSTCREEKSRGGWWSCRVFVMRCGMEPGLTLCQFCCGLSAWKTGTTR